MVLPLEELKWNFLIRHLKHPKTSDNYALEKKASENQESHYTLRDPASTESSKASWHKVETSQGEMELVARVSMERSLQMRISNLNTQEGESYRWLMQDQAQMDLNSSCVSLKHHIWMAHMLFSEEFPVVWMFLTRWKP